MKDSKLTKVKEHGVAVDVQIAAGMVCLGLLNQQGIQSMQQVLQGANDPAKALAHVIFLAISKVRMALKQRKMDVDERVWIMGGGVLDRVIFEVMMVLVMAVKYPQAQDKNFVAQVKSDVLDLMEDDDQNNKSMEVLHKKGLPMPKPPAGAQQGSQGLAAPQGGPPQGGPPQGPQQPPQQGAMSNG